MRISKKNKNIKVYNFYKRGFDIAFSVIAIVFSFPILLIIALLIKASSRGSIIFNHERIGKDEKKFYCKKFRTMHPEAESILMKILKENPEIKDEYSRNFKLKNDPRITLIGKFLRRTSLDELPQLINVLKGDMSIIGPRPIVKEEVKKYGEFMDEVFSVKPGITGLWQISGRNKLTYEERVFLDITYVRSRNFIMELRILLRTIVVILFPYDRGAY